MVLAAVVVMAAMVMVIAMPAMAKNYKDGKGEPLVNDNKQNYVLHCGPSLEPFGLEGYRGTSTTNANANAANCIIPSVTNPSNNK